MNRIGYSSRLSYDGDCAYEDKVKESTGPLQYMLDSNRIHNCNSCLSTFGPRSGYMGYGVSTPIENMPALAQQPELVNIESLLSNRNVKKSKCKKDGVNPVDVTKYPLKHPRICNDYMNPMSSRLSYPAANYRDTGINRFYNLRKNPQVNIFWDSSTNTRLEAKDNFLGEIHESWDIKPSLPKALEGSPRPRTIKIKNSMPPMPN